MPSPGLANAAVPLIGQRFTLTAVRIPVDAKLTCNCGGGADTALTILASVEAVCPSCGTGWTLAFNPTTMKLDILMRAPDAAKDPS